MHYTVGLWIGGHTYIHLDFVGHPQTILTTGHKVKFKLHTRENRLKVNSEREQDSPVEMGASNISRFKEMPFLKAKRHRAHSVVSGVRVKASKPPKKRSRA
ncbi:hypothetical protein TNCV_4840311 [Trichonephila clavipes]|nr:hypothetical protein TNCV_4840311 [Trichonephila clavipes]